MKNLIVLFICLTISLVTINAQCPNGDITILTQAGIDNFAADYPNCTQLNGDFNIGEYSSTTTNITNLNGLSQITSVAGFTKIIDNPLLTSLVGLHNVVSLDDLDISRNHALVDFTGLNNLESVGWMYIGQNDGLMSFQGFDNLTTAGSFLINGVQNWTVVDGLPSITSCGGFTIIGNSVLTSIPVLDKFSNMPFVRIEIFYCPALTNLNDMSNYTSIGDFSCADNHGLTDLSGLENLQTIHYSLVVEENDNLINLNGLQNVTAIGGVLDIVNNPSIQSLDGLDNLQTLGNKLQIGSYAWQSNPLGNPQLTDISALASVSFGGDVFIRNNDQLSFCHLPSICDALAGGSDFITNNASGCNSVQEVLDACPTICPTGDITLLTQADVNNFLTDYPFCTEFPHSLQIGSVSTNNFNQSITNLNPLLHITSVDGDLNIQNNENLTNLIGLHNLETVGQNFRIEQNDALVNLTGLENFKRLESNDFYITQNSSLVNFEGLRSLTFAGTGEFWIFNNVNLTSLRGMDNLVHTDNISITSNFSLTDLNGLENITHLNFFGVDNNPNLTSFDGLNEHIAIADVIHIYDNPTLAVCNVPQICNNLPYVSSTNIHDNAPGCNSATEIENNCTFAQACQGDITLDSQSDIDNFANNYPGCTHIAGNVFIKQANGQTITNLNGLSQIEAISGFLKVESNPDLNNLIGLNNLYHVGGDLRLRYLDNLISINGLNNIEFLREDVMITNCPLLPHLNALQNVTTIVGNLQLQWNTNLNNISGLRNLNTIGGAFILQGNNGMTNFSEMESLEYIYGELYIQANTALLSLEFNQLKTVGGDLTIRNHNLFSDLTGLERLNAFSGELVLIGNMSLSVCNYPIICAHLAAGNLYTINNNNMGCDTAAEISDNCTSDCAPELFVSQNFNNQTQQKSAEFQVRADNQISNNANVTYKSNNVISLEVGFEVENATFEAKIEDCNN